MKSKIQISDAPKRVNDIEDIKENIVIVESYINEDATDEQKFWILDEDIESDFGSTTPFFEGSVKWRKHKETERNRKVVKEAKNLFEKQHGRLYCEVCDFDFGTQYGKSGENYIEAHHIVPLSQITGIHEIKPTDFRMLCSNCHSIIHRRFVEGEELDVERLKKIIKIKFEV